ncbi:unnamed protein product, partial [Urochloa humidicola]
GRKGISRRRCRLAHHRRLPRRRVHGDALFCAAAAASHGADLFRAAAILLADDENELLATRNRNPCL